MPRVNMAVNLGGIAMQNPICTASGTFGAGKQFESFFDVSTLGAITCKGASAKPWRGNAQPRMTETTSGIMNSVGLQNPGVEAFMKEYGDYLTDLDKRGCRVICQVVGHSIEEYEEALDLFESLAPFAAGFELNISCPNVSKGGASVGATPESAAEVVKACRPRTKRPLLVKLAPHNVAKIARACEDAGADALTLINAIPAMAIDVNTHKGKLSRATAGLSGPAIHPIAVRMVWEAAQAVDIAINGVGGVSSGADAAEMILAGATTVSVGSASLVDPLAAQRVLTELTQWAQRQGVTDITELIGAVQA